MPTTILLIRHATHDRPGQLLVGRDDDVQLSSQGEAEARRLAGQLATYALAQVVTSPSRRCRMTADIIAAPHGLAPEIDPDVDEIDFGAWRGRTFAELDRDPAWQLFNTARGSARIPEGETILAVQARIEQALRRICVRWPEQQVAVITHGDVIRSAVCQMLGLAPDLMLRFEVSPASVSTVEIGAGAPRLIALNWMQDPPPGPLRRASDLPGRREPDDAAANAR
jgi:broad specificity phosphatase PhoE